MADEKNDPLAPDVAVDASSPPPGRLATKMEATIYLQHIVREFLLENIGPWRDEQKRASLENRDEDRVELGLVINQAEAMAKSLRMANLMLAADDSPIQAATVFDMPSGKA